MDFNTQGMRKPLPAQAAAGEIPQRPYHWTDQFAEKGRFARRWLRLEMMKGTKSNYVLAFYLHCVFYTAYRVNEKYLKPWKEASKQSIPVLKTPFTDSHNAMWGMAPSMVASFEPSSVLADPGTERPRLVAKGQSETGDVATDIAILQLREQDSISGEESFVRSVHYLAHDPADQKQRTAAEVAHFAGKTGLGEELIQGYMRCTAITPNNNCISNPSQIESEVTRKLLTALGPMYMLKDPSNVYLPRRFSGAIELKQNVLCVGLGGGSSLPQYLNRHFPHLKLDVVEPDGGFVRVCRKYLGFRERDGIKLFVDDPTRYLRNAVVKGKTYDAIFMDVVDENGDIPKSLCKLEFISNVKEALGLCGMVAVNLPNHDEKKMAQIIANWRLAFDGRTVVLVSCATAPNSILMTFNDNPDRGMPRYGQAADVEEFKELIRAFLSHFPMKVPFDLLGEVNEGNFVQLEAGKRYNFSRVAPKDLPRFGTIDATRRL
jgi:hypothetical protein